MVKARWRTSIHAHCTNAVPALTPSEASMRKAKVVPMAEAPAWECMSNEALFVLAEAGTVLLFKDA